MRTLFSTATALLAMMFFSANASAQLSITLGGDNDQITRVLQSNGYTKGQIVKRGLTIIRVHACKGNQKYRVKVSILGRITSTSKIEDENNQCAPVRVAFNAKAAEQALKKDGFTEINTEQRGRRVVATACYQERRYEINFNRRGDVADRREIGRCGARGLSKEQIVNVMRREGFERIVVTNDQLPRYTAEACRDQDRVRVTMNRRGTIRSERRIGQ